MPEAFHIAMTALLDGDSRALDSWLVATDDRGQAGLDVYRNTVAKARVDALAATFPSVVNLVGSDWFTDAAMIYSKHQLPSSPILDYYGQTFPNWLASFGPARDLPFLAPVARLDLAWSEAHRAADATVVQPGSVSHLTPPALFAATARLHPSVRLFWFDWTVVSIWLANRPGASPVDDLAWQDTPEGLVIVRHDSVVSHRRLMRPEWAFLKACQAGKTLGLAAQAAFRADPKTKLAQLFSAVLGDGIISSLETGLVTQ